MICDSCGSENVRPNVENLDLAHDLVCHDCGWEFFIPAETTSRTRIDAVRAIVREHSAKRIDGIIVDAFTARMLLAIYNALSPEAREKFGKIDLPRLVDFGWKHVKVGS